MTKHTPDAGTLPNASIDFDKVQANAKAGKEDIYEGALSAQRRSDDDLEGDEGKLAAESAKVRAKEAGFASVDEFTEATTPNPSGEPLEDSDKPGK